MLTSGRHKNYPIFPELLLGVCDLYSEYHKLGGGYQDGASMSIPLVACY